MERYVDAKDGEACRAFTFAAKALQAFLHWKGDVWRPKREWGKKAATLKGSLWMLLISLWFLPFQPNKLQLYAERLLSYCWQSPRLGFFPSALPDGFHDHAGLPGPVPSLLCLCHGATLAVLPCCRCWGYKSGERRLFWHPVPTWWPLPPSQTQTPP